MKGITHSIMFSAAAGLFLLCSGIAEAEDAADRASPITREIAVPSATTELVKLDLAGDWALRIERFTDEQWAVFELLLGLSSEEWQTLQSVVMLDAEQLTLLEQLLQQDGEAFVSADGCVHASGSGPDEYAPDGSAIRVAAGGINTVINKINNVLSKINDVRNVVEETRDRVREGAAALTGQIRDTISEALEDVNRVVGQELEGRAAFLGESGCSADVCEPFRQDMITLLEDIQSITNCLFTITELEQVNVDLSREIGIVEDVPGRILFPLYRVLGQESNMFESGLLPRLNELATDLLVLKELVVDTACQPIWDDPNRATSAVRRATWSASTFQLVGRTMISVGETEFFGDVGLHGYVHINVRLNSLKTWGGRLVGLADAVLPVVLFAGRKVDSCIELQMQEQNQAELLQGQAEILAAIKSLGNGAD